jgi:hypothetical protein
MDYYQCPIQDLVSELQRRRFPMLSTSKDELIERLMEDDDNRGSDATTILTTEQNAFVPPSVKMAHTAEFGNTTVANQLVNESALAKCVV